MLPDPLHPAVVHFPVVLAVLLPLAAVAALLAARRGAKASVAWAPVVAMAVLLAGSSWAATETGEAQEEAVEEVVPESAMHEHEEAGERFLFLSVLTLAAVAAGLARGPLGGFGRAAGTAMAVAMLVAAFQVGGSGGELVYEHGAATAYAQGTQDQQSGAEHSDGDDHDDDDDHDEGRRSDGGL